MIFFSYFVPVTLFISVVVASGDKEIPSHTKCMTTFMSYKSSPFEEKWEKNVNDWQLKVCEHITNDEMAWWIGNVTTLLNNNDLSSIVTPTAKVPDASWSYVMSVYTYKRQCVHKTDGSVIEDYVHVPIEPTAALARDPRKVCAYYFCFSIYKFYNFYIFYSKYLQCWSPNTEEYTQSKAYLLPLSYNGAEVSAMKSYNPHKTAAEQGSKIYLFDAGATVAGQRRTGSTNNWSGTEWIFDWYEKRGIVFDEVHAWEPTIQTVNPDNLKPALAKALHFNNVGITAGINDQHNPLAVIRSLCKPKDIVIFKLDIDNDMEMEVVKQLLSDENLMNLVDEFYFEHHVHNDVMKMHGLGGNDPRINLKTWYDMVQPARRKGFRMHFWP